MPKILLVKTSSMGDVIHNLPMVSDIRRHFPDSEIHWVVEEEFQAIPALHPGVTKIITVALRRWRKTLWKVHTWKELADFFGRLRREQYDFILDSQGLMKSALIARLARGGKRCGLGRGSAREFMPFFYDQVFDISWTLHAVQRTRSLGAQALGYSPDGNADYGISTGPTIFPWLKEPYAILLHFSSDEDKLWPESSWVDVGASLRRYGLACILPWGNSDERERSNRLAHRIEQAAVKHVTVPPRLDLRDAASFLAGAEIVIGVDTGLAHLAAALNVPAIGIYCASRPEETGLYSDSAVNLGKMNEPPSAAAVVAEVERILGK